MIIQHIQKDTPITLHSDLAGEFPIYMYLSPDRSMLLYSKNIVELLADARVQKPLQVSTKAVSFLLQSGVVPAPISAYEDIFILGIGDSVRVSTKDDKITLVFSYEFPFFNANRLSSTEMQPDTDLILQMLAEATIKRIDPAKSSFLFHSAGKDSNSIALALAEAGWQDKVTLITHKSKGDKDESEISKSIAKKLGFKHQVLHEVDELQTEHKIAIDEFFKKAPLPCTDNVTLAYPLYAHQLPELRGANVIDGGGNDVYMMTPPSRKDFKTLPLSKLTSRFSIARNFVNSESLFNPLLRTPAELFLTSGLSFKDTQVVYPESMSVYEYWQNESKKRSGRDILDFKTDILTKVVASELHIRKFRLFTDTINANAILPFANEKIANYFAKMPETYLFNRETLKNKLILRDILKRKIDLDSDKLGKMGFSYDSCTIVLRNWELITSEIYICKLWNKEGVKKVLERLNGTMKSSHKYAKFSGRLIYRLYLISGWHNRNRYIN